MYRALAVIWCGSLNSNGVRENISDSDRESDKDKDLLADYEMSDRRKGMRMTGNGCALKQK